MSIDNPDHPTTTSQDTNLVRSRILEAATGLFARKGYANTSVREIAEVAGATVPMLYYYFGSKEGLYTHLLEKGVEAFLGTIPSCETDRGCPSPEGSVKDYLIRAIASLISFCQTSKATVELILEAWFIGGSPSGAPRVEQVYCTMVRRFGSILQAGIRSGEFREVDTDMVAQHIVGIVTNLMLRHLIGNERFDPEEVAQTTVDFLVAGLAPRVPIKGEEEGT